MKEKGIFREEVKKFVKEQIEPYAENFEIEESIPKSIIQLLGDRGYLSLSDSSNSNLKVDYDKVAILNEEVCRASSAIRSLFTVQGMSILSIERWGTIEQKENYLNKLKAGEIIGAFGMSEENVGSDASTVYTTGVLQSNSILINGRKKWITMGAIADVFIMFVNIDEKVTAVLVEKNDVGVKVIPTHRMFGVKGSMLAEIEMVNCIVPKSRILGEIGGGTPYISQTCLDYGRFTIAWGCIGSAKECLEIVCAYTDKRKQFGKKLCEHELIQKKITQMYCELHACELLCQQCTEMKKEGTPDSILENWIAKYKSSKMINFVANEAMQILGAYGLNDDSTLPRHFRDSRANEIIEGTSEIHEMMIAKEVVNLLKNG